MKWGSISILEFPENFSIYWSMKKIIRLTESDLVKIVQQVIKEQDDSEGDATQCLQQYINFLFQFTEYDEDGSPVDGGDLGLWNNNVIPNPNDEDAYNRFIEFLEEVHNDDELYDDGPCENITFEDMLPLAKDLYRNHIKELVNQAQKQAIQMARQIFANNNSEDKFVDLIARLSEKYNLNIPLRIRRKLSAPAFINFLNDAIQEWPPRIYAAIKPDRDEFDYADYILQIVMNDNYGDFGDFIKNSEAYDEFYDYVRDNFGHIILEAWIDEMGFDD